MFRLSRPALDDYGASQPIVPGLSILVEEGPKIPQTEKEAAQESSNDFSEEHLAEARNGPGLMPYDLKPQEFLSWSQSFAEESEEPD